MLFLWNCGGNAGRKLALWPGMAAIPSFPVGNLVLGPGTMETAGGNLGKVFLSFAAPGKSGDWGLDFRSNLVRGACVLAAGSMGRTLHRMGNYLVYRGKRVDGSARFFSVLFSSRPVLFACLGPVCLVGAGTGAKASARGFFGCSSSAGGGSSSRDLDQSFFSPAALSF